MTPLDIIKQSRACIFSLREDPEGIIYQYLPKDADTGESMAKITLGIREELGIADIIEISAIKDVKVIKT